MKFQEAEFSNRSQPQMKHKTKGIILITDNRPKQIIQKGSIPNFRQSAFKQTEVDPLQVWAENNIQHDQDQLIEHLNRKLLILQERIKKLQKTCDARQDQNGTVFQDRDKKHRRKFAQMQRKSRCHFKQCEKIYGSDTALKHHLKIKHKVFTCQESGEQKQNNKINEQIKSEKYNLE